MVMDFVGDVAYAEAGRGFDEAQMQSAVDSLDEIEAMLQKEAGENLVER